VCENFEILTAERAELWPATNGRLTISAGVVFAPVSLPLSSSIEMAESLLASAKAGGRKAKGGNGSKDPAAAYVDWCSVVGGVTEHPATARQRDYRFKDNDIDKIVSLTRRPYSIDNLAGLLELTKKYQDMPLSLLHQTRSRLQDAYWGRRVWVERMAKHGRALAEDLAEPEEWGKSENGRWREGDGPQGKERHTDVLDAIELLLERTRMSRRTVGD
jgi:hypothetical protein